jgi:hypothetical protein
MLTISVFYLDKQKSFIPKKLCRTFFSEQKFFVCQDRRLKFSDSLIRETSQHLPKLSILINKKVMDQKKVGHDDVSNRDFKMQNF